MKKLFSMLMLGLILVLFLFSGCSEKVDIPSTPNNNLIFIQQEGELEPNGYNHFEFEEDCDLDPMNLPVGWIPIPNQYWYLEQILTGIEEEYITFTNENFRKVFTYQLKVVINMIKVGNYEGPTKKLEKVLIKTAKNSMMNSIYKDVALALLEAQHFYLKNPNYDYFVPVHIKWREVRPYLPIAILCIGVACMFFMVSC